MTTIKDYINNLNKVKAGIYTEQERIVLKNQKKITNLNKKQFTDGYGENGLDLVNVLSGFSGYYASGYKKSGLYDFYETGAFIRGLRVVMSADKNSFTITSSGQGSGKKSLFFTSYTNLYGLDDKNANFVNYSIIAPELMIYLKKYL